MSLQDKTPVEIRRIVSKMESKKIMVGDTDFPQLLYEPSFNMLLLKLSLSKNEKKVKAISLGQETGCREELTEDLIWARKNRSKNSREATVVAVENIDIKNIRTGIHILNHYEKKAGWAKTVVIPTQMKKVYVLVGSKFWSYNTAYFSLWLLLLRILSKYPATTSKETLSSYMDRVLLKEPYSRHTDRGMLSKLFKCNKKIIEIIMREPNKMRCSFFSKKYDPVHAKYDGITSFVEDLVYLGEPVENRGNKIREVYIAKCNEKVFQEMRRRLA